MKNFLWALAVVIIFGGGYLLWTDSAKAPTVESAVNSETVISNTDVDNDENNAGAEDNFSASVAYSSEGFSPSVVTIKKGETVRFLNTSNEKTWPASSIHPGHRAYPGSDIKKCGGEDRGVIFDACRGLIPGEMWDFTFTQVGTWKYHDHMHAGKTGSVTVTE
ncbi:MAG: hypothetical protein AAB947_01665 [Patescibacteria group bacterium]